MTFRTCLLVCCMVAVPAAALFSHRLPTGFRAAVRQRVIDGFTHCRAVVAARFASAVEDGGVDEPVVATGTVGESTGDASPPPEVGGATESTRQRLARLGVTRFDCHPLAGTSGEHVASCQLPLDAGGQLMRVFQATGRDGDQATEALATEVEAWRRRAAGRGPSEAAAPRMYR